MAAGEREQFAAFGLVQFVAAVHIFTHHAWQQTSYLAMWWYRPWGVSWVSCFFVLSGFKLTFSQMRKPDPSKIEAFVPYMWRRLVRLYPIFYLSMLMTLVLSIVKGDSYPRWIVLPFNLTLTFTWIGSVAGGWHAGWHGTHWYMSDLIFHQICWRWAFPVVSRLSAPACCLILLGGVCLTGMRCLCIQWEYCYRDGVEYWPPLTFHHFLSGMCLARLHALRSHGPRGSPGDFLALPVGGRRIPLSGLLSLALVLLAFQINPGAVHRTLRFSIWTGILLPLHLLLVWCLCLEEGPLDWLCQRRPFAWLGELSYGVYVFHWNALMLTKTYEQWLFPKDWSAKFRFWGCMLPATVAFSALVMVLFDRPIQAWASSFLRRSSAPLRAHSKTS